MYKYIAIFALVILLGHPNAATAAFEPSAADLYQTCPHPTITLAVPPSEDPLLRLVNREHLLPSTYKPSTVTPKIRAKHGAAVDLASEAAAALEALFAGADSQGLSLVAVSGYRSYGKQKTIFARSVERNGFEKASQMSAQPGASEHQLALAMDLSCASLHNDLSSRFARTPEGKWIAENAPSYGFILRYKADWSAVTGYQGEPWHIRYLGVEHALLLTRLAVPLEVYVDYLTLVWEDKP